MQTKTVYGVISLLVALLIISSTLAAYYYVEYSQASQNNSKVNTELKNSAAAYESLATEYNSLLGKYETSVSTYNGSVTSFNELASVYGSTSTSYLELSKAFNLTFSLLVNSISVLNTSEPAYVNATAQLSTLWAQYLAITNEYRNLTSSFETILSNFQVQNSVSENESIQPVSVSLLTANILLDFGNGTSDWFNNTAIDPGWNFYIATVVLTNGEVNATWYPEYSEHLVNGIDGVMNNIPQNIYWWAWTFNATASSWSVAQVGADLITMYNGSSYAWTYCPENTQTYLPTCTPP